MSSIGSSPVSPFIAASLRMQASANNIASVSSSTGLPIPDATGSAASSVGAQAFHPDARFAASYGLLAGPDVDLAGEIIEHLISSTSLIAIAQVINADSKMIQSLLDIEA